jgi:hypothetical protein
MSEPSSPSPETGGTPKLPELHNAILDAAQLEQLLVDIETCAELTEILPKYAEQQRVGDASHVTLAQARELLGTRAVRALQLRYRYENADWWDTVMIAGDRFRVVRIRHDFGEHTV